MSKIGLALGGGGAKGFAHLGAMIAAGLGVDRIEAGIRAASLAILAAREPSRLGLGGRDKFARWLECFCKRLRGGGVTIIGDKRRHLPLPGGLWGKV